MFYQNFKHCGKIVSHPGEYWMKSSFSASEPWQKVSIYKGRKKQAPQKDINVSVLYPDGHPLNPKKVADLQKMVQFLPPQCRDYYISLADHVVSLDSVDD